MCKSTTIQSLLLLSSTTTLIRVIVDRGNLHVAAYVAELRHLSEHCDFGITLNQMLRDRLNKLQVHRCQEVLLTVGLDP